MKTDLQLTREFFDKVKFKANLEYPTGRTSFRNLEEALKNASLSDKTKKEVCEIFRQYNDPKTYKYA